MIDISTYRSAYINIYDKIVLLLPEYELTDFPPTNPLSQQEAVDFLQFPDVDLVIAGFVEKAGTELYSSCIIIDDKNTFVVRKVNPFTTELDIISEGIEPPPVLPLSIGNTIILLCYDAPVLLEDINYINNCIQSYVDIAFLVSAWKNKFELGIDAMNKYVDALDLQHCYIIDRFNGLVRIR